MRIYKIAALTLVFVLGLTGYAVARDDIQTLDVRVTPSKLDKKKFNKSAKIFVDIDTVADPEVSPNLDQPPSADRTQVDFPANLKFNTKAAPNCKAARPWQATILARTRRNRTMMQAPSRAWMIP